MSRTIVPSVNLSKEYWGTVDDFADRREIIREAISNSLDEASNNIWIDIILSEADKLMTIKIKDDGNGMNDSKLETNFFGLGESDKENRDSIGEKGHGTKTYICGKKLLVETIKNGKKTCASMEDPISYRPKIPEVVIEDPVKTSESDGTLIIIKDISIDGNDIDVFRYGALLAYINWETGGGRTSWIWDNDFSFAKIHLSVKGYSGEEYSSQGKKGKIKNNGKSVFDNKLEWKIGEHIDLKNPDTMYKYYEPVEVSIPNSDFKLRLAFANLGPKEKEKILSGSGFKVADRMGAYLSKDGINIERYGAEWLTTSQEWSNWIVLADTKGWDLTQNRGAIRIDSFYREVVNLIQNEFQKCSSPTKSNPSLTNETSQSTLSQSTESIQKEVKKLGNLSFLTKTKTKERKSTTQGVIDTPQKKKTTNEKAETDKAEYARKLKLGKNHKKITKEFSKNITHIGHLINNVSSNLVQPDENGKIRFSNTSGGLVKKCQNLQTDLDFEVEFAYPIFSSKSDLITWVGSIYRNSKSVKVVFCPRFEDLMSNLPVLHNEMIIIIDKNYKLLESSNIVVMTNGMEYGTCTIIKKSGIITAIFKSNVEEQETSVEVLSI